MAGASFFRISSLNGGQEPSQLASLQVGTGVGAHYTRRQAGKAKGIFMAHKSEQVKKATRWQDRQHLRGASCVGGATASAGSDNEP